MKFIELAITGYRSLVDVTLPLHPLTVMIGPNGSGKTSLLDVFLLLREATQENLASAIERRGGLNVLLPRLPDAPDRLKVALQVDAESTRSQEPMCYRFELAPRKIGYTIPFERLEWGTDPHAAQPSYHIDVHDDDVRYSAPEEAGFVHPTWDYKYSELALAQVPRMHREPEALRAALARTRYFSYLDVGRRSVVRLPQPLTPADSPGPNGESLYSALYNLRALHRTTVYGRIEETLQQAFPDFAALEFPVVGAGQVTMAWYQSGLSGPLYPSELSEGTLRFLWLVTVLLTPKPPPVTLIDEPEVSLHPELLKLLAALLQDASSRGLVVVATHSADLVRWLQPDEVLVLDKTDGRTTCTWADTMNLDEWLKEYTLADLWLMGIVGGRP